MKTKNILIAFVLNLFFSIFELIGGLLTGSISIMSDSIHDLCDALSIGISYLLENKSNKEPDNNYTYGYLRYSVLGAFITTTILIIGSVIMIYSSILRLFNPVEINYDGMIILSIIGVIINLIATNVTSHSHSLNEKSVHLHMLEDVLNWIVVLVGSIVMKFTDIRIFDSLMCIGISIFIFTNSIKNFKEVLDLFLIKIPNGVNIENIKNDLNKIKEIKGIHHVHVWSIDGFNLLCTMHVICDLKISESVKERVRQELKKYNIIHTTIEIEEKECNSIKCDMSNNEKTHHH